MQLGGGAQYRAYISKQYHEGELVKIETQEQVLKVRKKVHLGRLEVANVTLSGGKRVPEEKKDPEVMTKAEVMVIPKPISPLKVKVIPKAILPLKNKVNEKTMN